MSLTEKEIYDLNNRNVASQNVQLGTILSNQSGDALTEKQMHDLTNDNVITQKVEFGKIINAIATGDMTGIDNLTEEQQNELNNIDSSFQNVLVGSYVEEIIEGGEPPVESNYLLTSNNEILTDKNGNTLSYTPKQFIEAFLTFSSPNSFTLSVNNNTKSWDGTLEYSTDKTNWTTWGGTSAVNSANDGVKHNIFVRGIGNTFITGSTGSNNRSWRLNGYNISISGNIESLLDYATVELGSHPAMGGYAFQDLFAYPAVSPNRNITDISGLVLGAEILTANCYRGMFQANTGLTTLPSGLLPATTLAARCYIAMFWGCASITTAPVLPATTLADYCYSSMFYKCISLTQAPKLPATTLAQNCYSDMFAYCASLTTVPELPATTLEFGCYDQMFFGCTSLYVSDTQITEAQHEWKIPKSGVIGGTPGTNYQQFNMFIDCLGTRSSNDLPGQSGQQYVYYTQNEPV